MPLVCGVAQLVDETPPAGTLKLTLKSVPLTDADTTTVVDPETYVKTQMQSLNPSLASVWVPL